MSSIAHCELRSHDLKNNMEIRKAPTLRLKALNKHSIYNTHNVHQDFPGNPVSSYN